ncbi:MAG: phenylalanine--tRNA ligase subunit alpha [Myxococcota bacterium]|jgi:phenylalanyl-tRNA synthetase alpha chain|nr:phenylalanine--tRNA ligase subunit alpha [Myxococcota bacterium]MEC9442379.1 phenylalanine--tRNA ligase subunit alpha [Myxococcota bacterium]
MDINQLEADLLALQEQAIAELQETSSLDEALQVKNRYLGRKGQVQSLMGIIRELPNDQKPQAGQISNRTKKAIEASFDARKESLEQAELMRKLAAEAIDVTLPSRKPSIARPHPLTRMEAELTDIFADMGFEVAEGPEIEQDFYNFEALNFPHDHPARDMQDTFMLEEEDRLLRTHTSPVQIRTMLAYKPPIKIIAPGRVYRCDSDITHSPVFHQVEGLLVDKDVTMADLKGTLTHFAQRCFGDGIAVRFRPSFFPFTEPSAEVDIGCIFCNQEGCRVCSHTGWLEILGCGMVDPNVFEACGIDPDVYTGFAFGMGVERIAMLKHRIGDIRLLFENDLRFLEQFD